MHHTRSACCFSRGIRNKENRPQRGSNDTSHEVRCLLAKATMVIVDTPAYLTDAIRSQGFSPSQRFDPTMASRLCFAPHPPIGFWPSELFPPGQPRGLSALRSLLPLNRMFRNSLDLHWRASTDRPPNLSTRLRLQSLDPTRCPTPDAAQLALRRAAALLTFSLSEA
jgi:hypothetical protein